jgi:hypothetical protein
LNGEPKSKEVTNAEEATITKATGGKERDEKSGNTSRSCNARFVFGTYCSY